MFLNTLAGFAVGGMVGAGSGALSGSLVDYGINDGFIRSIGETARHETSALFLLVRKSQPEKVLAELSGFKGRVIRSSLPNILRLIDELSRSAKVDLDRAYAAVEDTVRSHRARMDKGPADPRPLTQGQNT